MLRTVMQKLSALAIVATGVAASVTAVQAQDAKHVNFITDFGFNGRHAYYYVALDKGFYKDAGLDVDILRGQGSADAIKKVASGTADIGFADAGSLILARGNDGVPVKMVSVVYGSSPHAVFTLEGSGITSPKDLEGRTVGDTASSAIRLLFPAYAKTAGIDADKVEWVAANSSSLPSLLARGQVDAIGQFTVGEPLLAAAVAPKKLVELDYSDAGMNYYGNGLIASEAEIESDPEMIKAFVAATYKGLEYALAHPEEAGEIMHNYQKQVTAEIAEGETRRVGDLLKPYDGKVGAIDPQAMENTVMVVESGYELKTPVKAADVYVDGFVE